MATVTKTRQAPRYWAGPGQPMVPAGQAPRTSEEFAERYPDLVPVVPPTPMTPTAPTVSRGGVTLPTPEDIAGEDGGEINTLLGGGTPADLSLWRQLYGATQTGQQLANLGRIPNAGALEQRSSDVIAQLLNPPEMYADTSRLAAEYGAARGVPGSASAFQTGLRLTRNEQLRDLALGQQMLTAAYGRNPSAPLPDVLGTVITPEEQAEINARNRGIAVQEEQNRLARERWDWERRRLEQPSVTYSGAAAAGGGVPAGARTREGSTAYSRVPGAEYGGETWTASPGGGAGIDWWRTPVTPGVISGPPVQSNPLARTSTGEPFPEIPYNAVEENLGMPGYPDYIPGQYGYAAPYGEIPSGTGLIIDASGQPISLNYNPPAATAPAEEDFSWLYW